MVDESIIKKLHALMAKTVEAGCSEEEALAAAKKLQELLHKYQLSMSDIRIKEEKCTKDGYETGIKAKQPIDSVITAIAQFTDTKTWRTYNQWGHVMYEFFGFEHDVLIAKYITKLCDNAIIRETENFKDSNIYIFADKSRRPKLKNDFGLGMAYRLAARLREMKAAQQREDAATTGRDLVVVKSQVVADEFRKANIELRKATGRSKNVSDYGAFIAGSAAGDRVALNPGVGSNKAAGHIR